MMDLTAVRRYFEAVAPLETRAVTRSMLNGSVFFDDDGESRHYDAIRQRLSSARCCTKIIVVGSSTPCGKGSVGVGAGKGRTKFATAPGVRAAGGTSGAWPRRLQEMLNNVTRHCCPEGHHLDNHCRDSTGIDFQLQTFDERLSPELQSARAAGKPADLVVVDTTSVDFNLLWMKAHKMDSRSLKEERHNATRLDLEAFLRRFLAVPHAPGLAFAETAWLDNSAMGRTGTKGEQFGAWIDHAPILRHYGVPAVAMPVALEAQGMPASQSAPVTLEKMPLARKFMYVDGLHLSRAGHWMFAFFVANAIFGGGRAHEGTSARHLPARFATELPAPVASMEQLVPRMSKKQTYFDFTSTQRAEGALSQLRGVRGWAWKLLEKVDGKYIAFDPRDPKRATSSVVMDHGKLGLMASWEPEPTPAPTFEATVKLSLGTLQFGYLRSYEGRADARIDVWACNQRNGRATGQLPVHSEILNGSWEMPISIYTSHVMDLRTASVVPRAGGCSLDLRVTMLPGASGAGDFTIYTIASY